MCAKQLRESTGDDLLVLFDMPNEAITFCHEFRPGSKPKVFTSEPESTAERSNSDPTATSPATPSTTAGCPSKRGADLIEQRLIYKPDHLDQAVPSDRTSGKSIQHSPHAITRERNLRWQATNSCRRGHNKRRCQLQR